MGPIRLREALIQSLNIVSIKIVQSLGLEKVLDCFKKYNFDNQMLINDLSIALGTGTINPLKAAENYSILINEGQSNKVFYIDRVEDIDGNIIFDPKKRYAKKVNSFNEVSFPWLSTEKLDYLDIPMIKAGDDEPNISIDPRVAFMISDILNEALIQNVKRRGLEMPITNMGGKTGTTNDATSTWFSGYASQIEHGLKTLNNSLDHLSELAIGGTAVGTGLNTPNGYAEEVADLYTGLNLRKYY